MLTETRVPVTVLTGFLGSGKTTLLNRILTENHGKRIAVIENEFGEIGIDNNLVISADEEIFEMNNGCICCTVRGDLIRILGNLMRRRDRFDYIMIETTGLADPAPVAQTFFVDEDMQQKLRLDGVVTVVDAHHVWLHLDDSSECQEQIAFADVILLNKTDLVTAEQLEQLEQRIRAMNGMAQIHRTVNAEVAMDHVLNIGGFDLDRALEKKPTFLEPEYPFEWGGVYTLTAGTAEFVLNEGPDPAMEALLLPWSGEGSALAGTTELAARRFSYEALPLGDGGTMRPGEHPVELQLNARGPTTFRVAIDTAGTYVLYTQHQPIEFAAVLSQHGAPVPPVEAHVFNPEHEHDEEVTSVGLTAPGAVDLKKLNKWFSTLLMEKGVDIFRMKGILSVAKEDRRFVFQGVHMLFDGRPGEPWRPDEVRGSQLVFIGRHLDRASLTGGFQACLA